MPPDLPGFHYDAEHGKYFKIVSNQHATNTSKYSKAAVTLEKKRNQEVERLETLHDQLSRTRIKRNDILHYHPLGGVIGYQQELGGHEGHTDSATAAIWAKGLQQHEFIVNPHLPQLDISGNVRHFVRDPATGAIVWTGEWSENSRSANVLRVKIPAPRPDGAPSCVSQGYEYLENGRPLAIMPGSETSSVSFSPARVILATGLGVKQPPSLHLTRLADPSELLTTVADMQWRHRNEPLVTHGRRLLELDGPVSITVRLPTKVNTAWCSAAGPSISDPLFAVGTSHGITSVRLDESSARTRLQGYDWPADERLHDTLAVTFLNNTSVLCGMRSGKVRMWDTRSNGASVRFQHGSCVSHIRAIEGGNKVLVAGLHDQLSLYDLRFIKALAPSSQSKALKYTSFPPSLPFHSFPTYRMQEQLYPRIGFDVHRNLVASGTEDGKVQIFDLHTGRELDVGMKGTTPNKALEGHARCLKYVDDEEGADGLRLLVANGRRIDAWTW